MDDTLGSCGSLPPFLSKTYEMVDDSSTDLIVSWSDTNKSFVVWNQPEFSQVLLPKYFKHNNFSSFIRQLNTYGFRKIDPEKWEFANDDFVRGQPNLMRNIHRRKPVHSHSVQNVQKQAATTASVSPLTESERKSLKENVERLKNEKESLVLEVEKHEEERAELHNQIQRLRDRFHLMEKRHKNVVSNMADLLQKPGLALTMLFESEPNDRKRRLPRVGYLQDEGHAEEGEHGTSRAASKESIDGSSSGIISLMDLYDQLEASLTLWENIMSHAHQTFVQLISNSNNLELDEANSCAEGPAIDMNAEPTIMASSEPTVMASSEPLRPLPPQEQKVAHPVPTTGVNDVFWEQFLTENPGSSENQEVQSVRKDKIEGANSTDGRYWWSLKTLNNLAEQMGHLTSAEKT